MEDKIMANEKKTNKKVDEAQNLAKKFLQGKARAKRFLVIAQKEFNGLEELRKQKHQRLREAQKKLDSFDDNDDILNVLAGMEPKRDEAKFQAEASKCLFELLAMIHKSGDDQEQKTSELPTLREQIDKINPSATLFEILKKITVYDEKDKILLIDGKALYTRICKRIEEQEKHLADARITYAELEANVNAEIAKKEAEAVAKAEAKKAEAEAKKTEVESKKNEKEKSKTAKKNNIDDKTATADKTAEASSEADEKKATADKEKNE